MKIIIENEVHQKIMCWVNASNYEVSGFGNVVIDKDGTLRVVSAHLCKQMNSHAETDIKAEDVAKALFEARNDPGEMRWWWHSHVNMAVFWSHTDHQAMKDFASTDDAWMICTVFNKKNEHRSAYYSPKGSKMPWGDESLLYDEVDTIFEPFQDPRVEAWKAEYDAKVTNLSGKYWEHDKKEAKQKKKKGSDKLEEVQVEKLDGTKSRFEVDNYGLTRDDWKLLGEEGWDVKDVDALVAKGFTARQISILCANDYAAAEVLGLVAEGYTVHGIMMEALDTNWSYPRSSYGHGGMVDMREGYDI